MHPKPKVITHCMLSVPSGSGSSVDRPRLGGSASPRLASSDPHMKPSVHERTVLVLAACTAGRGKVAPGGRRAQQYP